MFLDKSFRSDDSSTSAIGCWATMLTSEHFKNSFVTINLFFGHFNLELRIWIVGGMTLIFGGNFGEMTLLTAILFHMFFTSITEELRSHWSRSKTAFFNHSFGMFLKWECTIIVFGTQTTTFHFFKTKSKCTVSHTSFDELCCLHESS